MEAMLAFSGCRATIKYLVANGTLCDAELGFNVTLPRSDKQFSPLHFARTAFIKQRLKPVIALACGFLPGAAYVHPVAGLYAFKHPMALEESAGFWLYRAFADRT